MLSNSAGDALPSFAPLLPMTAMQQLLKLA